MLRQSRINPGNHVMRISKLAFGTGLAIALAFGATSAAYAWDDASGEAKEAAAWKKRDAESAAEDAAAAAAYKKRVAAIDAFWAKVDAERAKEDKARAAAESAEK